MKKMETMTVTIKKDNKMKRIRMRKRDRKNLSSKRHHLLKAKLNKRPLDPPTTLLLTAKLLPQSHKKKDLNKLRLKNLQNLRLLRADRLNKLDRQKRILQKRKQKNDDSINNHINYKK